MASSRSPAEPRRGAVGEEVRDRVSGVPAGELAADDRAEAGLRLGVEVEEGSSAAASTAVGAASEVGEGAPDTGVEAAGVEAGDSAGVAGEAGASAGFTRFMIISSFYG